MVRIETNNHNDVRFKATDNYPGPPLTNLKRMGNVRCPSYHRAIRGLYANDRTPPPEYKVNRSDLIIESVRSVITDSFTSWFSITQDEQSIEIQENQSQVQGQIIQEESDSLQTTYRIV